MARFCVEGNQTFDQIAAELDIPFRRTGKLIVGYTAEDREKLLALKENGERVGGSGYEIIERDEIDRLCPAVGGNFALLSKNTGILNPFQYVLGLAENAAKNGVRFFFNHPVTAIRRENDRYLLTAGEEVFSARWVINCAGLFSDRVSSMLGIEGYTLHPCRGEYFILDQRVGALLPMPAYPVPNPKVGGLGIHITPTIDGNVLIGPSNEYIDARDDYSATAPVMELLLEDAAKLFPHIRREDFIRNFSGIRPKRASKEEGGFRDFVIERRDELAPHTINLVGIESPGLTSATPIAKEVVRLFEEIEPLEPNPNFDPIRKRLPSFAEASPAQKAALIAENLDYGEIICRCETITKAEVLAAIRNPLGVDTVTGIKYRCRAMMGRCQGGYCQTRITELILQETGKKREELCYSRPDSYLFTGKVRGNQ